jgi:hypothetical protein
MNYKIISLEKKETSTGKPMLKASIVDETGEKHEGVAIWSDFPNFANLKVGEMVVGDLQVKQNGQYTNKSLSYPKPTKTQGFTRNIEKNIEKKQEGIRESQEHRDNSVRTSATARDATLIVTTFYGGHKLTDEQIKDKWLKWRRWLWFAFEEEIKNYPPFESIEPQVTSDGTVMPFSDDLPPDELYDKYAPQPYDQM